MSWAPLFAAVDTGRLILADHDTGAFTQVAGNSTEEVYSVDFTSDLRTVDPTVTWHGSAC